MSKVTFPAHFDVATNPATGEEFILPDDRDLDKRWAIRLAAIRIHTPLMSDAMECCMASWRNVAARWDIPLPAAEG